MNEYELGSHKDKDGVRITMVTKSEKLYLSYLYKQVVGRLMTGIRPEADKAIELMKQKYPKRLKSVMDELFNNYSVEGLKNFERSMVSGFKKLGVWNGRGSTSLQKSGRLGQNKSI